MVPRKTSALSPAYVVFAEDTLEADRFTRYRTKIRRRRATTTNAAEPTSLNS